MKKVIIAALFILGAIIEGNTQTVKQDSKGNYYAQKSTTTTGKDSGKVTGKTYTDSKGEIYPVYISKNGKLFIYRISRNTGQSYKYYLKVE